MCFTFQEASAATLQIILEHHLPKCFSNDLPMYILLSSKLMKSTSFVRCEQHKAFVSKCIGELEGMEPDRVAGMINNFVKQ